MPDRPTFSRWTTRLPGVAVLTAVLAGTTGGLGGCAYLDDTSDDNYLYESTPFLPVTVTIVDTRTDEEVWTQDVPVGNKLKLAFSGNGSREDPFGDSDMRWFLRGKARYDGDRSGGLQVPTRTARRIDVTYREAVEPAFAGGYGTPSDPAPTAATPPPALTPPPGTEEERSDGGGSDMGGAATTDAEPILAPVDEPTPTDNPVAEEPVSEPVSDEPFFEESVVEEPVTDETVADEPALDEPAPDESAEEPIAEPAAEPSAEPEAEPEAAAEPEADPEPTVEELLNNAIEDLPPPPPPPAG